MMDFQIFAAPIIGGVIGYITNDIAIKMLFHPRKALYIGKFRVPFTPGLIPKEKDRVAKSVGNVISTQLLDSETLVSVLASDEMLGKIRRTMEGLVERNRDNSETLSEFMLKFAPEDVIRTIIGEVKADVAGLIHTKLTSFEFGESVSKNVLTKLRDKMSSFTFGLIGTIVDDNLVGTIAKSTGELINKAIADNSKDIIENLIGAEVDKLKDMQIKDLIAKYEPKFPTLTEFLINGYKNIIENHLTEILRSINLSGIVEKKISDFSVAELENMIFGIMRRELKAIVYLGAVLGFILGWLNMLIYLWR